MTPMPHTVAVGQPLAAARELMRERQIRHFPVLHGGQRAGVLSERDAAMIAALPGVGVERLVVGEAMMPQPHTISPDSPLEWVAAEMAQQKLGSLIVVEDGRVVGIFTTVDALHALGELLGRARRWRRAVKHGVEPRS